VGSMDISESIKHLKNSLTKVKNWDDDAFSYDKAFICGVVSNLAYCHISKYELENTDNVNLIPSDTFAQIISENSKVTLNSLLVNLDINNPIVIERAGSVTVAIELQNVIFISMRGTANFKDWRTNVKFGKIKPSRYVGHDSEVLLHKGFYFEVQSFFSYLFREIYKRKWHNKPIYITGHSLGGALAAITYALTNRNNYHFSSYYDHPERCKIMSCYTFGMPRWGNTEAVEFFESPYHIFVKNDIVPTVPPKILGYEDCYLNYAVDDQSFSYVSFEDGRVTSYLKGLKSFFTKNKLEDHRIENYVERIYQKK